ncbi:MAG: type II/IV secretion system protein [Bdellovibrionales bacterium]|nr:type II/IV secretion system protein [Bdellovibrionales bacterium]
MDSIKALKRFLEAEGLFSEQLSKDFFTRSFDGPILALSKAGKIDEQKTLSHLSKKLDIKLIDLADVENYSKIKPTSSTKKIQPELLRSHRIIPLWEESNMQVVATCNPFDIEILKLVEFSIGKPIKTVLAKEHDILRALNTHYPLPTVDLESYENIDLTENFELISSPQKDENVAVRETETPPIIKLCNKIIADAVASDASDIHIEPTQSGVEVRFRVDGIMHAIFEIPKNLQAYVITRFKILSGMDIAERRKPQDGRIRVILKEEPIDLRSSSVPTSFGEKIVLRILRSNVDNLNFKSLSIPSETANKLSRALDQSGRIILVTGPTGSGKTTTLYSCLNRLRDGTSNIETVEDPIEYRVPGINQIQINQAAGVTFASALRSVLRQDPDVIMIGEIRDKETAEIALQAAQTGHLVLSTLHTNSAPAAISRLLTIGADPFVLSSCLSAVISQRLVRKICPDCSTAPSETYLAKHADIISGLNIDKEEILEPQGCLNCNNSGYKSRIGIYSFLEITEEIENLILTKAPISEITSNAKRNGYKTLLESASERLKNKLTSCEEIRPYFLANEESLESEDKSDFNQVGKSKKSFITQTPIAKDKIQKSKVVLVEDDEDVRRILALLLEKEMFEVIEAENGLAALNAVYEHNPTLVLCDLMMPVMDGREFLLKMQSNNDTSKIPVIILTAADTETNETGLLDLGAADFVSKTSSSSVMLSRVRRVLSS